MKRWMTIAAAILIAAPALAASDPAMNATAPATLHVSLNEMGLSPEAMDLSTDAPSTVITVGGSNFWLVMGGCTDKRDCDYLVVGASFKDVVSPPAAWVAEQNVDFDLMKVWVNDERLLTYSAGTITQGLTRAQFRAFLDALIGAEATLGRRATEAKLVRE